MKSLTQGNHIIIGFVVFSVLACNKMAAPDNPTTSTNSNIVITAIKPTHGPYDTIDTLMGNGFDQIPTVDSILINGKRLAVISRSDGEIIVKIPSLTGTGNVDIWYGGRMITGPIFAYDSILMVTTVAGTTDTGEINGNALNARFWSPVGIAVDHAGNIYVAEEGGSSIRKIDTGANVTTLAGPTDLEEAYVDGTGASARFSAPLGLCIDRQVFLYVADQNNQRVRKVSTTGVVTTYAGAQWDGIPGHGGTNGPASVATFDTPYGVACDKNGNIYVADIYNNEIRKITTSGSADSLAGGDYYLFGEQDGKDTSARFYYPQAIASDSIGNLYVVDDESHLLRKITPDGTVTTLLGPMAPSIMGPYDPLSIGALAVDKYGDLFFSISVGIIKMTPDGTIIRYATGGIGKTDGPAQYATYRAIAGIAVDDAGTVYITDENRIRKIAWQ
jgi:sugar lactone lactonase YvrE